MQIEVNARKRKNWARKLEKQPRKKVEAYLGNVYSYLLLVINNM